jgi:hypothetical protein
MVFRELELIPVLVVRNYALVLEMLLLVIDLVPVKVFIKTCYTCSCDKVPRVSPNSCEDVPVVFVSMMLSLLLHLVSV